MNEHYARLRSMVDPKQQTWDLSPNDVAAIKWALDGIEELERTCQNLASQVYGPCGMKNHHETCDCGGAGGDR